MQHQKFKITPLAAAMAAVLSSSTALYAQTDEILTLEEIVVTARKRSESVMDIPSSIQALSSEDIKDMGARGVADYSRFVPSINIVDYGSGVSDVIFRGATAGAGYVLQSTSSVYVDEISVTTQGQQPSIRMVDVERIEALAGPQGTLYGSDSQAGTLRIITNKPDMTNMELILDGSLRNGSEGEGSYDGSVVLNLPLIEDKLAMRLVAFKAKDGGFIDNVYGHTFDNNAAGYTPSGWGTLDNADVVKDDINDVKTTGWRAAVRWDVNEDWTVTASTIHQKTEAGSFASAHDPSFIGDLKTINYNKEYYDVEYDISSLVIEADLGFAQLVSATSYYESETEFVQDVTNYQKIWAADYCRLDTTYAGTPTMDYYYVPPEGGGNVWWGSYCNSPTTEGDFLSAFYEEPKSDRFSQEIRLFGQGDTFDWLVGLYYEKSNYSYVENYGYPTANINGRGNPNELYQQTVALDFNEWYYGDSFPNATETWFADSSSDSKQKAVFGEVVWHATDQLDITVGARYFDRENETTYFEEHPTGNLDGHGVQKLKGDDSEVSPKLAISYDLDEDSMVYVLWTEGYRPGGTNRQRGEPTFPKIFDPDKMTNWEAGYKTELADGAVRLKLAAFYMDWEDYQFELIDPSTRSCPVVGESVAGVCGQPYNVSVANAGDAHILGTTFELDWAVASNFVVGMNAEWLEAESDTEMNYTADTVKKGSRLPVTPKLTGAAWATYNFPVAAASADGYARLQWSYTGSTLNKLEPTPVADENLNPQFENASYNIGDFSIGMKGDTWEASFFINNITDERASYTRGGDGGWPQQNLSEGRNHIHDVYTNRPREYGIRVIKRWGG